MVSRENVAWLKETGRRYVIGTPKAELKRWAKQIEERTDWRHIRDDVEVKLCRSPDGDETFVLCRSASRVEKERAMHDRFKARIDTALASLERRIEKSKKPLDRGLIERQIGRLLERNSRAAGRFTISITDDAAHASGIRMSRAYRAGLDRLGAAERRPHILRTNVTQWSDEELWTTYIQLTEAEAAFRVQKSDLAIRPIWHHKERPHQSAHPRVLPRHALWKTFAVAVARRARSLPANHPHGVRAHSRRRHRVAAGAYEQARTAHTLRGTSGARADHPARTPWPEPAVTRRRHQRLKCSADLEH
ncbi:MAG: hypothetical protein IPI02_23290 [Sterolibacteriaceae bacterium]|nr:hypothetical protein [Sterolibacteriaceae bacterium]